MCMHEELWFIRQQMEEDFLLHSEGISAQNQSVELVECDLVRVGKTSVLHRDWCGKSSGFDPRLHFLPESVSIR